ncbi:hypothetical protein CMU71_13880 [Elizabethkingia anophelis]|uniref:hypothetical protein n=1 Tax=Elizabethkingia anophelis TaxID=1117645 RepID=UPI001F4A959B|nr:hypothetical protein [Elizabethkingia anophelis]MDV3567985.1 hypothetical protein [Elizabethkingia anophelis]MDV3969619.1 hypothetical protein [Elizabethkingia anophelis]
MGESISGEHHDLYKIEETLEEILSLLSDADIECKGLFLNANLGNAHYLQLNWKIMVIWSDDASDFGLIVPHKKIIQ